MEDGTGLRVYAGAHVFIRLLGRFPGILECATGDCSGGICELGCGTGMVGILGLKALIEERESKNNNNDT